MEGSPKYYAEPKKKKKQKMKNPNHGNRGH